MTTADAFTKGDLSLMWHVMSRWAKMDRKPGKDRAIEAALANGYPNVLTLEQVERSIHFARGSIYTRQYGWLVGAPLVRHADVFPVVNVSVKCGDDDTPSGLAIRVALLQARGDGSVHAEGWRFEQGEDLDEPESPPAHPYAHAQAIKGWVKGVDCLLHPPHDEGDPCSGIDSVDGTGSDLEVAVHEDRVLHKGITLDKHPAFPLGVETMTGLMISAIATLYGSQIAKEIVDSSERLARAEGKFRKDLVLLRLADH